jgi:HSP20 family protein
VKETDKSLEISLESPGMTPGDFDIKVERQTLIVCGQKHYEFDRTQGRFHVTQRTFGNFERLIPLPCLVNEDEALATDNKGVLRTMLPKKSKSGARKTLGPNWCRANGGHRTHNDLTV